MPQADNYRLCIAGLSGTPYISKISKREPNVMTDDRRKIPEGEFISAVVQWAESMATKEKPTIELGAGGKVMATITVHFE